MFWPKKNYFLFIVSEVTKLLSTFLINVEITLEHSGEFVVEFMKINYDSVVGVTMTKKIGVTMTEWWE